MYISDKTVLFGVSLSSKLSKTFNVSTETLRTSKRGMNNGLILFMLDCLGP